MQKHYLMYNDAVLIETSLNTNQLGLGLTLVTGISSEGKNIIMGIALIARETVENYSWILVQLRDMNNGIAPKTVVTDFDIAVSTAIENTYISSSHLIGQWHIM